MRKSQKGWSDKKLIQLWLLLSLVLGAPGPEEHHRDCCFLPSQPALLCPTRQCLRLWPWSKMNSPKSWFCHLYHSDSYPPQRATEGLKEKKREALTQAPGTQQRLKERLVAFLTCGKTDQDSFYSTLSWKQNLSTLNLFFLPQTSKFYTQ